MSAYDENLYIHAYFFNSLQAKARRMQTKTSWRSSIIASWKMIALKWEKEAEIRKDFGAKEKMNKTKGPPSYYNSVPNGFRATAGVCRERLKKIPQFLKTHRSSCPYGYSVGINYKINQAFFYKSFWLFFITRKWSPLCQFWTFGEFASLFCQFWNRV